MNTEKKLTLIVQVIGHKKDTYIYFCQFSKNRQKIVWGLFFESWHLWALISSFLFVWLFWLFIFKMNFPTFWSMSNKSNYFICDQLNISFNLRENFKMNCRGFSSILSKIICKKDYTLVEEVFDSDKDFWSKNPYIDGSY